jgi:hypothetical protein
MIIITVLMLLIERIIGEIGNSSDGNEDCTVWGNKDIEGSICIFRRERRFYTTMGLGEGCIFK